MDGRRLLWLVIVVFFLGMALAGPVAMVRASRAAGGQAATSGKYGGGAVVQMKNIAFSPATLTVARGTEVVFQNLDTAPHTVTGKTPGGVDSGTLNPGKSFSLVVDQPLDYVCTIHPSMTGKILLSG